jgi:flagellar protein FliS
MDARLSYREAAVQGASPVQLIALLYEQTIADLRRAVTAIEQGNIEARTREINHALLLIGQLQGTLDMERGGKVAQDLDRFYNMLRASLGDAQVKQSAKILEEQISCLGVVHGAWIEVDRLTASGDHRPAPAGQPAPASVDASHPSADWSA